TLVTGRGGTIPLSVPHRNTLRNRTQILGDVSYFMVMPTRYRKEGTVQADGRRGPPVSERADSRLPAGQKRSAGLPAPAAANVRGSSSGTNLNQVDLAARRQSFERMMKAALERDNGSMTVAEVSGPYFPEIVHDQAAGVTPSPCPAAAAGASHQYAHDRLSESLNIPRCKGASQQTAVRRTPSVETADGEPSLADAKRRSITSSEPSLKVKLHRKSWARSPEETGGLLAYQIPDYPPEVRRPFDGGAAGGAGRGSVSDEGRRGEKGEDEEQAGLVSSTSAATIDSERFGGDVRSPAGLSAAEAAADWPGYQAVFIGTDDHFLTMASLRKIFEVNAVDAADSRLFEIPPAVLRQEGILLTEEDEEEEDGPPDGRAVSGDAERTFAPGTGGGPPPAPQPAHAAGPPRGQQLPRGPGTVLVPGHGVMSLSNVAGDPSTDAVDGGHAAAGPLDADDRTKETDRLGTWAGRSPRYLQRSLRRHQYPLILLLGLLVGVAFHFTLPPDDAWKAVTGALGASAVVVVARMYARRKRQRELIRQDAAARRY
ncbi:MAG: hypothetical protein BJ554DRAFT_2661, partial [Olpidium bornovanus]